MSKRVQKRTRGTTLMSAALMTIAMAGPLGLAGCANYPGGDFTVVHIDAGQIAAVYQMPDVPLGAQLSAQKGEELFSEFNAYVLTFSEEVQTELLGSPLSYDEITDHPDVGFSGYQMMHYVVYGGREGDRLRFRRIAHSHQGIYSYEELEPIDVPLAETLRVGSLQFSEVQADATGFSARVSAVDPIYVSPLTLRR